MQYTMYGIIFTMEEKVLSDGGIYSSALEKKASG